MAAIKFLNLIALSSLAILASSFGTTPVSALATQGQDISARHVAARGHDAIAKRKRASPSSNSKRCKARPASSSSSSSSAAPAPTTSSKAAAPKPSSTSSSKAPASSSSSAPATAATGTVNGSKKVGLAWPNGDGSGLENFVTGKTQFIYTWAPEIPSEAKKLGLEGVPMLWGARQIDDFKKTVVKGYANWVLGMNEPNESGQSNMSPEDGAKMWQQYIQPLKNQGYKLISPATSSNPNGLTWVKNFMKACDGCTFDAVAVHWYGVKAQDFIDYVNLWHTTFNKNIWVTEFACQNFDGGAQANEGQIFDFMKTALNFLEGASFVDQYFAFGIMHDMQNVNALNQLMAGNNKPTALGSLYLSGKK